MWKELGWAIGELPAIWIDMTKGRTPKPLTKREDAYTVYKDGPVTGELGRDERKAPEGTLLEGHLWTTGDRIYGRYHRAHLPDGRTVPICLELHEGRHLGMIKSEWSKPGHTVGPKAGNGITVKRWNEGDY